MPLHIQLLDRDGRPLAGASLVIHFTMKRAEPWSTDPMRSDAEGFIRMDGLADRDIDGVVLRQSTYVVAHRGRESAPQSLPRPQPWQNGAKLLRLQVAAFSGRDGGRDDRPEPGPADRDPPEDAVIRGFVRDGDGRAGAEMKVDRGARPFIVRGQVQSVGGEPVAGLELRALHVEIGSAILLGAEKTGADGHYRIVFTAEDFAASGKRRPDLIVELHGGSAGPEAVSELIPDARHEEIVNFAIGDAAWRGPSLYAHVGQSILPHLKPRPDFQSLKARDVSLLAARTGIPALDIGFFIRAWRLADEADLDPASAPRIAAPFFAFLRAGLPATLAELALLPAGLTMQTLADAMAANLIPDGDHRAVLTALRGSRVEAAAKAGADMVRMFARAGLAQTQARMAALDAILDNPDGKARWTDLNRVLGADAGRLKAEVEVWSACGGNMAFAEKLGDSLEKPGSEGLAATDTAVIEKLALANAALIPAHVPGTSREERAANYAAMIRGSAELRHPQTSFLADIGRHGPPDLVESAGTLSGGKQAAASRAGPGAPDVAGLFAAAPVLGRGRAVAGLWEKGYRNLDDIALGGRRRFRANMAVEQTDEDGLQSRRVTPEMDKVFDRAVHLKALGQAHVLRDGSAGRAGQPSMVDKPETREPATIRSQLFEGASGGGCSDCDSVVGPSAYLLDLFRYVGRAGGGGISGRDILDARRPDLAFLKLNCANTDTVMPYIDLVLEVLEDGVAGTPLQARQTSWTTQQLLAGREPGAVNAAAYDVLREAVFPWTLPHDEEHGRVRALLDKAPHGFATLARPLGIARGKPGSAAELAIQLGDGEGTLAWAIATLGVAPALADIDVTGAFRRPHFGGMRIDAFDVGAGVGDLAETLQVTPEELSGMLRTRMVADGTPVLSLDGTRLEKALDARMLNALQSLGRLMRQIGLSSAEVDRATGWIGNPVDIGLGAWLIGYASACETASRLGMDLGSYWLVFEALTAGDIRPLADAVGQDAAVLDVLMAQSGLQIAGNPSGLFSFLSLLSHIQRSGLDLSVAASLLAPAPFARFAELSGVEEQREFSETLAQAYAAASMPVPEEGNLGQVSVPGGTGAQQTTAQVETPTARLAAALEGICGQPAAWLAAAIEVSGAGRLLQVATGEETADATHVDWLSRLAKTACLAEACGFDAAQLEAIAALSVMGAPFGSPLAFPVAPGEAWGDLPLAGLAALAAHADLDARIFAPSGTRLFTLIVQNAGDLAALVQALAAAAAFDAGHAAEAAAVMKLLKADAFIAASGVVRLARQLAICGDFGVTPAAVHAMVTAPDGAMAQDWLRRMIPVDNAWYDILKQVNDPLREKARDALLAHVLSGQDRFRDANDVYEHLLLDPKMSACFATSRIVQAAAALQHLVQRIQLGLETAADGRTPVEFEPEDLRQWPWRKTYRVWEANRKVFLYPENWVEPDLRDDKTALFRSLEDALLQEDIRDETAEAAIMDYVRGLHDIANLEIMGLVEDDATGEMHVVGRTRELPHKYHTCRRMPNGLWTGWEPVDAEIEGEHFVPVIHHRRTYLFWATTVERLDSENADYALAAAGFENAVEDLQSEINTLRRTMEDVKKVISEQQSVLDDEDVVDSLSRMIATAIIAGMTKVLEGSAAAGTLGLQEQIDNAQAAIAAAETGKAALRDKYTYLEFSMNWTVRENARGWMPQRRTEQAISTIYEIFREPQTHYRHASRFFLLPVVTGERLTIRLVYSDGGQLGGGETEKTVFGNFVFDVVGNTVRVLDHEPSQTVSFQAAATGYFAYQKLVSASDPGISVLSAPGGAYETLLASRPDMATCLGSTSAWSQPGEGPLVFDLDGRTVLAEPVSGPLKALESQRSGLAGVLTERPEAPPSGIQPWTGNRPSTRTVQSGRSAGALVQRPAFGGAAATVVEGAFHHVPGGTFVQADAASWMDGFLRADIGEGLGGKAPSGPGPAPSLPAQIASEVSWKLTNLYHPFTALCITELHRFGTKGLFEPDHESGEKNAIWLNRQSRKRRYLKNNFGPTALVDNPGILERFEFVRLSPFATYNWELFFHAPILIANQLTRNRRFAEAQRWLHTVFNPIDMDRGNPSAWRLGVFRDAHRAILEGRSPAPDDDDQAEFEAQVGAWEADPFNPHAIARLRTTAYMRATFMAYLDNLLAWADDLFSTDTRETVGEAAQLYVLALQMLGREPLRLPDSLEPEAGKTVAAHLDVRAGFDPALASVAGSVVTADTRMENNAFFDLFGDFCMPDNDKLLDYWSTIHDRLFKIRHCMNIEGLVRTLPLFQPPIDPALLVRAAAAGLDIGAAVSGLDAPRPHYRFTYMIAKANDFAGEVKALGASLLSALEKRDAEDLSLIRASHEATMAERMLDIRKDQVKDAETSIQSVDRAIDAVGARRKHYLDLIAAGELKEEKDERTRLSEAQGANIAAQSLHLLAGALTAVPTTGVVGFMPEVKIGGTHIGGAARALGDAAQMVGGQMTYKAGSFARGASRKRLAQDWQFQSAQALIELERLQKDRIGAEIRLAMAQKDVANQQKAIDNARQAETFLKGKFTGKQLYGWMVTELSRLHYQAFQLALELARQAEACYRHEIEGDDTAYVGFSSWDSMRKGLLAGERLAMDLRRLEAAYLARNTRVFELRKNVSLARLNPVALMKLRTGQPADFDLPEYIFDLDHPGHYNRRIKAVSITIPAVAGPQTVVGCELQLNASIRRVDAAAAPDPAADRRYHGQRIATSGGQNDAGLFQFDFRDERYLPFEGAGAVSNWTLRLPGSGFAQFDHASITDVVIHLHYTARGDDGLRETVSDALTAALPLPDGSDGGDPAAVMLSLRHDFPGEWARLANEDDRRTVTLDLVAEHLPYVLRGRAPRITGLQLHPVGRQPVAFSLNPEPEDQPLAEAVQLQASVEAQTGHAIRSGDLRDLAVLLFLA